MFVDPQMFASDRIQCDLIITAVDYSIVKNGYSVIVFDFIISLLDLTLFLNNKRRLKNYKK